MKQLFKKFKKYHDNLVFTYPLKFVLLNLRPQGRYRMVFGYHFVKKIDLTLGFAIL